MLRSSGRLAVAVRLPDGRIATAHAAVRSLAGPPLVRGVGAAVQSLWGGLRASALATRLETGAEVAPVQLAVVGGGAMVAALLVFVAGPGVAAGPRRGAGAAAVEAVLRAAVLAFYLVLVGRSRAGRQLFRLHAAEHRVVAAYETWGGLPPVEAAARARSFHPRCGSMFVGAAVAVAGIGFAPLPRWPPVLGIALRLATTPVCLGVAYELVRAAGAEPEALWAKAVMLPGLLLQRLVTREPTEDEIEVAMAALRELMGGSP